VVGSLHGGVLGDRDQLGCAHGVGHALDVGVAGAAVGHADDAHDSELAGDLGGPPGGLDRLGAGLGHYQDDVVVPGLAQQSIRRCGGLAAIPACYEAAKKVAAVGAAAGALA
jgi:hypothetical protein